MQLENVETRHPIDDVLDAISHESVDEKSWYPYVYGGLSGAALQKKRARRYERRHKDDRLHLHEGLGS